MNARDRICGQSFMAGTICSDAPDHEGPCSCRCQVCGGDWMNETCTCDVKEGEVSWLEQQISGAKWRLNRYLDSCEAGDGETFWVDVDGYGIVTIENWSAGGNGGTDVYNQQGQEISYELNESLGDGDFDYLLYEWIHEVSRAYWDEMRRLGYDDMVKKAEVVAKTVLPSPAT